MRPQEAPKCAWVALADLPQHPTAGFVDEVMAIPKQRTTEAERIVEIAAPNEGKGRDHRHAATPQRRGRSQPVEEVARTVHEPLAEEGRGGQVHEIPVIESVECAEIEACDPCATDRGGPSDLALPCGEGEKSLLMPGGFEKA
jgi:hypothetical protein